MTDTKTLAILIVDAGLYGAALQPAWHHVVLGTLNEDGFLMVTGQQLIDAGCTAADDTADHTEGWIAGNSFAFDADMYIVLNEDVQYSNLKLTGDSCYFMSCMDGAEVKGFHIDAALGGPDGYAVTGTEAHKFQPKFEDDEGIYLWPTDQVEVLPVITESTTLH